jgi:hypothetical protein
MSQKAGVAMLTRFGSMCSLAAICLVIGALTACATGTQFIRPTEDFARLGETTRAQVEARLGKPDAEENYRQNGLLAKFIQYTYSNDAETTRIPNTLCVRSIEFVLVDDVVFAELFVSACASDHTDFDERRASEIVKGETRCDEVPSLLGRPAYRAIYPIAKERGAMELGYNFQYVKRPLLQLNMYVKTLSIVCDANGIVREVSLSETGDR